MLLRFGSILRPPDREGHLSVRLLAPLTLIGLGLLYFADLVVQPTGVLWSDASDLLSFHLPSRRFLIRSAQETGELPLWCPFLYAGMPFVHDIQSSMFYPPHWPLLALSEQAQGAALSWLVVLHVLVGGLAMFAYARHRGLDPPAALIAGIGFMFAGKWLLHLLVGGHYNMIPIAWLPLVLLWLEQAIERRSVFRSVAAGAAFSLFILAAYPYVTLYAGLFVALWSLGVALDAEGWERPRWPQALTRWAGFGLGTVLVAVLLGAVQLLPSLEGARLASRNLGVAFSPSKALLDFVRGLVGLAGPGLIEDVTWKFEDRGGLGLLWVGTAALAPLVDRRPLVRFYAIATVGWFVVALTGAYVLQVLPGFHFFRIPSRMLLVAGLPISLLTGITFQALLAGMDARVADLCRPRYLKVVIVLSIFPLAHAASVALQGHRLQFAPYWAVALFTVPAAWLLLGNRTLTPARRGWLWGLLLLLDLVLISRPELAVRSDYELFEPSAAVRFVQERADEHGRVLDAAPQELAGTAATPLWPDSPMVWKVEPVRGFNPIDVLRTKEYLVFVTGEDRPLRALDNQFTGALLGELTIREPALANLLGIRYLLWPDDRLLEEAIPDEMVRRAWHPVARDPRPMAFNFIPRAPRDVTGRDCGFFPLLPYTVYENRDVLPRVFVVHQSAPLADRSQVFEQLRTTDFRRRVLLEGGPERSEPATDASTATLVEYRPNCVTVEVEASAPGFLVLADVWFPGWVAAVDGQPTPIYRANYLFRAVDVPAGKHRVSFSFEPASYRIGLWISGVTAFGVVMLFVGRAAYGLARGRR